MFEIAGKMLFMLFRKNVLGRQKSLVFPSAHSPHMEKEIRLIQRVQQHFQFVACLD